MKTLGDLQRFIADAGIAHFTAREVCPVGKLANGDGPALRMVPEGMWPFILPTLEVLEWLRTEFGSPITIVSGYRDPAYNAAVGGEKNSFHMKFMATDIRVRGKSPAQVADRLLKHPRAPRLGIGRYTHQNFVHVDCRGFFSYKAPARWGGDNADIDWWYEAA